MNNSEPVTRAVLEESLQAHEMRLLERIERMETTLLNEFRKWTIPINARGRNLEP